jgi:mono/diheme cytochrome c family protein
MNVFRLVLALACAAICGGAAAATPPSPVDAFATEIRPMLDEYCAKCHGPNRAKGGINLAGFTNTVSVYREPKVWEKVLAKVQANEMPPENKPQPTKDQRESLIRWAQKTLDDLEQGRFAADPGRVRIHRLSRTEYNCTIRDLLGVDTHPA